MSEAVANAPTTTSIANAAAGRLARTIRRGTPILLFTLGIMVYLGTRFHIAINDQVAKCLPPYKVFLVDRHDRTVDRGGIYAFFAGERMAPFFPLEMMVIKRVAGGPGDRVVVAEDATTVNGERVGEGLDLAKKVGKPKERFARELVVPPDAVWMMGATRDSFDSRYWGPLPTHQILGRAYALF